MSHDLHPGIAAQPPDDAGIEGISAARLSKSSWTPEGRGGACAATRSSALTTTPGGGRQVQPTPQSLIAEGLAELALEVVVPDEPDALAAQLLTPLGIPYDEEIAGAVRLARNGLRFVRTNILQLLDQDAMSAHHAHEYARKWMLEPPG